jgi:hypothetical protein
MFNVPDNEDGRMGCAPQKWFVFSQFMLYYIDILLQKLTGAKSTLLRYEVVSPTSLRNRLCTTTTTSLSHFKDAG